MYRAIEYRSRVLDGGVAEVLHDKASVSEAIDAVADMNLTDLSHLLTLFVRACGTDKGKIYVYVYSYVLSSFVLDKMITLPPPTYVPVSLANK